MAAPKMTAKEALGILEEIVSGWLPGGDIIQTDAQAALACLTAMADDHEALQKRFDDFKNGVQQLIFDLRGVTRD